MLWRKTGIPLPRAYKLQGYCATGLSNLPSEQFLHIFLFFFPFQVWDLQESVSYIIDFRSRIVNILLASQDVGIPLLYLVKVFVLQCGYVWIAEGHDRVQGVGYKPAPCWHGSFHCTLHYSPLTLTSSTITIDCANLMNGILGRRLQPDVQIWRIFLSMVMISVCRG